MNKKILFCATVDIHFKAFHLPYLKWFKERGWEVHVAALGDVKLPYVDKKYNIPIQRTPFNIMNIKAYKELKNIIDNNDYQIIHCHTPMGGVISRLAARHARKNGTKVLYTVHGFHFCKGAPILNWLLYYPIEKILANFTDCLLTINEEDYMLAKNHRFKSRFIKHIHGVGVNTEVFHPVRKFHKDVLRAEYGYGTEDFIMFYAAEFNKNKNQQFLIKAIAQMKDVIPHAKLLLAGEGFLLDECKMLSISLGVEGRIEFLGYRNDVDSLLKMSDIAVSSSFREGLPVNIMEAMACGLPVISSINRGHKELVHEGQNGFLVDLNDEQTMSEKIKILAQSETIRMKLGIAGRRMVEDKYSIEKVLNEKSVIYDLFMDEMEEFSWAVH